MQQLTDRVNRSRRLGKVIAFFSGYLANYRGVPILAGIVFTFASFVLQMVGLVSGITGMIIAGVAILHIGILIALIGILLAEPLGKA